MNIIAIDIGNTNISIGLFVEDTEKYIETVPGTETEELRRTIVSAWEKIPFAKSAKVKKRDGVIVVSSVNGEWTRAVEDICKKELDEKIRQIGREIPLPIEMGVDNPSEVGTDRVVSAAAAFAVIEDAVVVADFGTAVTIDMVDEEGVFLGGVIAPGFEIGAEALKVRTDKLPKLKVEVKRPKSPFGANTLEAINCGLYYSAVGLLRSVAERYAEELEKWPQVIVTGGAAEAIKADCDFVDSWVPNLPVRGIVLAYKKFLFDQAEIAELEVKNSKPSGRKK
jgi:type III pantothenate kinase